MDYDTEFNNRYTKIINSKFVPLNFDSFDYYIFGRIKLNRSSFIKTLKSNKTGIHKPIHLPYDNLILRSIITKFIQYSKMNGFVKECSPKTLIKPIKSKHSPYSNIISGSTIIKFTQYSKMNGSINDLRLHSHHLKLLESKFN